MADQNDLTTNVALYEEGKTVSVTTTTDGSKERLDVSSKDVGSEYADEQILFTSLIDTINLGTGANEKDVFLMKNPVSSGVLAKIEEYIFVTAKVSQAVVVRIYIDPTVTADGSALAEVNKGDAIDGSAANVTTFQSPTISARGTKIAVYGIPGAGESRHIEHFTLIVKEDTMMLMTIEQQSANQELATNVTWAEVPI